LSNDPDTSDAKIAGQAAPNPDKYGDKLVKYIPAEVIAFYVSVYALVQQRGIGAQVLVLVVCLLGLIGYLIMRDDGPHSIRVYSYVLAVVAFLATKILHALPCSAQLIWLSTFGQHSSNHDNEKA
jgi:hypothetical protein